MGTYSKYDDAHLVGLTLRGNTAAYRQLIDRYRNVVFGLAVSYLGDFDRADDAAQEAFIRGYYRLNELRERPRFGPWLRTITANVCRMELRKAEVSVRLEDDVPGPESERPDRRLEQTEERESVLGALDRLPEAQRQVLVLYYLEEMNVAPIARFLEITEGAAKVRLHRARGALREEMDQMAERLTEGKRGPEFGDRIDLMEFGDLSELADDELVALVASLYGDTNHFVSLILALQPGDPETLEVRDRFLEAVDEDTRKHLTHAIAEADMCAESRHQVLSVARTLQEDGSIRPRASDDPRPELSEGTISVESFDDLTKLDDSEIETLFREIETRDLAASMESGRKATQLNKRIQKNVSDRVWNIMRVFNKHNPPTEERRSEVRREIVNTTHRLQDSGAIRPAP